MNEDMRIKYLFVNLKYPAYVKLQIALCAAWLILGCFLFLFARDSSVWVLANSWWLCAVVALGEVVESLVAIAKAKRKFTGSTEDEGMHNKALDDTAE